MTCEPYLAFCAARRAMDFRIRDLQAATREALSGLSPRLASPRRTGCGAGRAAVDPPQAFLRCRRRFAETTYRTPDRDQAVPPGSRLHEERLWAATVAQIRADMQGLLLAEIETRLLPTWA